MRISGDNWKDTHNNAWHVDEATTEDVTAALARLDGKTVTLVVLEGPDDDHLAVGGGSGRYVVYATFDGETFWNLIGPATVGRSEMLIAGGQEGEYPDRQIVDLDRAQRAAVTFARTRQLDEALQWEKQ